MFRIVNDYLSKLNIVTDPDIYDALKKFLDKSKSVSNYSINENFNRYIVDIKLSKYTVILADVFYRKLEAAIAYPYSHISVRYNEENRVRYRFASCQEDKTGVYMDIIISGK